MSAPLVRAVPATDDYVTADGSVVLLGTASSRAVRLSVLGGTVRELCEAPVGLEELAAGLEERFGPPPEGALSEVVAALVDAGVLEWVE